MNELALHDFHQSLGAEFTEVNGAPAVAHYGTTTMEYRALTEAAGALDFSFRGRICLTGADRARFLHGQVTNEIKSLRSGEGTYAAVVNAKGKMEADANIYCLDEELLLDVEPGLARKLMERLEKYIVADDVQVVDVGSLYGLLSVQGPRAEAAVGRMPLLDEVPRKPSHFLKRTDRNLGEIYIANQPRLGTRGFDLFVPIVGLRPLAESLLAAVRAEGGGPVGWQAFEFARIEACIPRFGADIDNTNFPQESGIDARAMSYSKGCYIGQEVLNRIHTMGHVNRVLRGLQLAATETPMPAPRDKLFKDGQEVGYVTSVARSPRVPHIMALGYVRKEVQEPGTELVLRTSTGEMHARVVKLPFVRDPGF